MRLCCHPKNTASGFTLVEVVMSLAILGLVFSGLLYGYVQANRMSEWSAMSLAAQAFASQGVEQARAAQWDQGAGIDQMPSGYTAINTDFMDIPMTGQPTTANVTNIITISTISSIPPLRQIRSDCIWTFPSTGKIYTNTVISYRSPDR
jgi:prepilin-type N-terminal cleavage/methylation domain-containing protein